MVVSAADGTVAAERPCAIANEGIGFSKALRNAAVPKVSVRAIPNT